MILIDEILEIDMDKNIFTRIVGLLYTFRLTQRRLRAERREAEQREKRRSRRTKR